MDWEYVDHVIESQRDVTPALMARMDGRVRRTIRRRLTQPTRRTSRNHGPR
jgi:hypothetical protein